MPIELPAPKPHARFRGWSGPEFAAAVTLCAGASTACLLLWTVPTPLVLPAICVLATLSAGALALIAWATAQRLAAALSYWDVAGALTLIGVFAALLSEPELALPLIDNQRTD